MPTSAFITEQPTLDRAAVLDRMGGDEELLREITSIFLSEYPSLLEEIRTAISTRDADRLQHNAHTLKGSVSNFGASAAIQAALDLEMIGRRGRLDDAPTALRALEENFAALTPALEGLVGGQA